MREQPGTEDTKRSIAIVYEAWSVATQAPGGMTRLACAISLAGTPEASFASATTWNTVSTTSAAAAIALAHGRISLSQRRVSSDGSAASSRDTGSAITSPTNGAMKPA